MNGVVDLSPGYRRATLGGQVGRSCHHVRDVIVVGVCPAVVDIISETARARMETPPADIRGFDVRTGKLLGRSIPSRHLGSGNDR
jgi:hypothetical protein